MLLMSLVLKFYMEMSNMATLKERAREVKDFVEQVYKLFGFDDAQASAIIIDESGKENRITSFWTAEPAKVTVDNKGNVEIILRKSNLVPMGMMFYLLRRLVKDGMMEIMKAFFEFAPPPPPDDATAGLVRFLNDD